MRVFSVITRIVRYPAILHQLLVKFANNHAKVEALALILVHKCIVTQENASHVNNL